MERAIKTIRECIHEMHVWNQTCRIYDNAQNYVDLTLACGKHPVIPPNAANQPDDISKFPHGSCYLFGKEFYGLDAEHRLISMLSSQCTCPGAIIKKRSSNKDRSANKIAEYSLYCDHYETVCKLVKDKKYSEGKMSQDNTAREHVKSKKTRGTKVKGVNNMLGKRNKKRIRDEKIALEEEDSTSRPAKSRRTDSYCAPSKIQRCLMHIRYFLAQNNRWYLATSSNFQHTGHPYLPPSAVPLT